MMAVMDWMREVLLVPVTDPVVCTIESSHASVTMQHVPGKTGAVVASIVSHVYQAQANLQHVAHCCQANLQMYETISSSVPSCG